MGIHIPCAVALLAASAALLFAVLSYRRTLNLASTVDVARVEGLAADLQADHLSLLESHKRLRSRIGMQERRARDKEQPDAAADPAEWKRRMRLQLHQQQQG